MNTRALLEGAFERRAPLRARLADAGTDAYRLFAGEADGIPGLAIDRYGGVAVVHWHEGKCRLGDVELGEAGRWLVSHVGVGSVYLKRFIKDRSHALAGEGEYAEAPLAGNPAPEVFPARENGVTFLIRPFAGFSTGLFLDQRENRAFLAHGWGGKDVLNTFAYTCGFSVALAAKGARTTSVDLSKKYLDWGRENFAANGIAPEGHRWVADDAFHFVQRAGKRGETFDLVVADPPSFSRGKDGVFTMKKDFARLYSALLPLVRPGGGLFFSTNFSEWDSAMLGRKADECRHGHGEWERETLPALPADFGPEHELSACLVRRLS